MEGCAFLMHNRILAAFFSERGLFFGQCREPESCWGGMSAFRNSYEFAIIPDDWNAFSNGFNAKAQGREDAVILKSFSAATVCSCASTFCCWLSFDHNWASDSMAVGSARLPEIFPRLFRMLAIPIRFFFSNTGMTLNFNGLGPIICSCIVSRERGIIISSFGFFLKKPGHERWGETSTRQKGGRAHRETEDRIGHLIRSVGSGKRGRVRSARAEKHSALLFFAFSISLLDRKLFPCEEKKWHWTPSCQSNALIILSYFLRRSTR